MKLGKEIFFLGRLFCLVAIVLIFSGCSRCRTCEDYLKYPPPLPDQKLIIIPKPLPPLQLRQYYLCLLKTHGVQVIRLGQTWTIILPSDALFENETDDLNANYLPVLNIVADFLRTYDKIRVSVTSYTDRAGETVETKFGKVTDVVTQEQAIAVVRYLTKRHVNARLLYAVGAGDHGAIAWNGTAMGRHLNRRVEIHFRYYRSEKAWY